MNIIVKVFLAYLETHPEVIEKLVEALIKALINHLDGNPTTSTLP